MTGDGELQEGQNWEALQAAAHERLGRLWVVVDRNELQSDKPTEEILALGDLEEKLARVRLGGRDAATATTTRRCARRFARVPRRATSGRRRSSRDTIKGKGVSFMEHPAALAEGGGTYRWHAGAPDDESFERAFAELRRADRGAASPSSGSSRRRSSRVDGESRTSGSLEGEPESGAGAAPRRRSPTSTSSRRTARRSSSLARAHEQLVVLDADLASDCRVRAFELAYPGSLRRVRDRRAGHGLDRGRARATRLPAGRELVRVLPRLARERADLQPGERGDEGRLRAPLRGADPGRAGEVAPESCATSRCSPRFRA